MGITNIRVLFKQHNKIGIQKKHISQYSGKKIAIDLNNYLYRFLYRNKKNNQNPYCYLRDVLQFIFFLRKNNVLPIFVIDGAVPPQKLKTIEERCKKKESVQNKIIDLIEEVNDTLSKNLDDATVDEIIHEVKEISAEVIPTIDQFTVGNNKLGDMLPNDIKNKILQIDTLSNQCIYVTKQDKLYTTALFRYLGIPYVYSPWEADDMCGYLYKNGYVSACMSEDMDFLAHGVGHLLRQFNTFTGQLMEYHLDNICSDLKLSFSEFLDMCILCGTDYYKIKGLGPKTAYKMILKDKSIEKCINKIIQNEKYNLSADNKDSFNYKEIRQLFMKYMNSPEYPKRINSKDLNLGNLRWDKCHKLIRIIGFNKLTKEKVEKKMKYDG